MQVKKARRKEELDMQELADKAHITKNRLRRIEKKKTPLTQAMKKELEKHLDYNLDADTYTSKAGEVIKKYLHQLLEYDCECVIDETEEILIATCFTEEGRSETVIRQNQLSDDCEDALYNEAVGLKHELIEKYEEF